MSFKVQCKQKLKISTYFFVKNNGYLDNNSNKVFR